MTRSALLFKGFECLAILILSFMAIVLTWEVFMKYNSSASTFKRSEKTLSNVPTIVICFSPVNYNYTYGKDFNISKFLTFYDFIEGSTDNVLKEGENEKQMVSMTKMQTVFSGTCYKLTSTAKKVDSHNYERISVTFHDDIPYDKLPIIEAHFTSEENSYGIARAHWLDGDLLVFKIQPNQKISEFVLREENYIFLKEKSECREESFYHCYGTLFLKEDFNNCPKKCLPHTFPNETIYGYEIPYCKIQSEDMKCASRLSFDVKYGSVIKGQCIERSCQQVQYSGTEAYQQISFDNIHTRTFAYAYMSPGTALVYEEYLIYDLVGVFGSIGGQLGLFLGFSFVGMMSFCLNHLQLWMNHDQNQESKNSDTHEKKNINKTKDILWHQMSKNSQFQERFSKMEVNLAELYERVIKLSNDTTLKDSLKSLKTKLDKSEERIKELESMVAKGSKILGVVKSRRAWLED